MAGIAVLFVIIKSLLQETKRENGRYIEIEKERGHEREREEERKKRRERQIIMSSIR